MFRSILSLIAGFAIMTFTIVLATLVAASVLGVSGEPPYPASFNTSLLAATVLAAGVGGYCTAALAHERRTGHAMILALMILIMQTYNVMNPQQGYERMDFVWLVGLCPLAAIAGGWLRQSQMSRKTKAA
jgi:hypothetical protein